MMLTRVISGGQNGADRAGLDAAKNCGIPTGGTAARGWMVQSPDGDDYSDPSLANYGLTECSKPGYPPRTVANVQNSDGTVWLGAASFRSPGGKLTIKTCQEFDKPYIECPSASKLGHWIIQNQIQVLNVAGNRVSNFNPTIYEDTYDCLVRAFQLLGFALKEGTP